METPAAKARPRVPSMWFAICHPHAEDEGRVNCLVRLSVKPRQIPARPSAFPENEMDETRQPLGPPEQPGIDLLQLRVRFRFNQALNQESCSGERLRYFAEWTLIMKDLPDRPIDLAPSPEPISMLPDHVVVYQGVLHGDDNLSIRLQ